MLAVPIKSRNPSGSPRSNEHAPPAKSAKTPLFLRTHAFPNLLFAAFAPQEQPDDETQAPGAQQERSGNWKSKPRNNDQSNGHKGANTISRNGDGAKSSALRHDKISGWQRLTFLRQKLSDPKPHALNQTESSGGFGTEKSLEARSDELDTHHALAIDLRIADVHHTSVRGKIGIGISNSRSTGAARRVVVVGVWYADFEIGTDGHIKTRDKCGAIAAKIFARRGFFESDAASIATANSQWQAHGYSAFGTFSFCCCDIHFRSR
jgi:hypothetical protein